MLLSETVDFLCGSQINYEAILYQLVCLIILLWFYFKDYTDFLLRHKAYREALAAGKKFMPRVTPKLVPDPKAEEVAPEIAEIGKLVCK